MLALGGFRAMVLQQLEEMHLRRHRNHASAAHSVFR